MSRRFWVTGLTVGLILAIVAIVLPLAFQAIGSGGPIGKVPDNVRSLIANPPKYDCLAAANKYKLPTKKGKVVLTYIPNAVGTAANKRDYTDSVNISAIPANADRINASICTQPEEAGMVGVALVAHQPELAQVNSRLFAQFKNMTVKEWADKVFSGKISYENATKTMTQLAGFMTIFDTKNENSLSTAWNYAAQEAITTKADVRPIVVNSKEYTGDFVVYYLTKKGLSGCWVTPFGINIGIGGNVNLGDQRIAGFTCKTPTPKPVPKPVPTPSHTAVTPPPTHTNPPVICTQPGEHVNSQGHCSKGSNNAIVAGTPKDNGDALQTVISAGSGSSGTIDLSGTTGSNGKTDTGDNGGQSSGANTGSTNSGTTDPNESSNNGGTSSGDTGSGNTNTGDPGGF